MRFVVTQAAVLQTLNDQATTILRERIISGALPPGSRVLEIELAEELGISRGTLRAALQQLSFEGLVVQKRFRSTFVASLTAQDAYEVYTMRNTLEAMAARIVAGRVTDRVRTEISQAIADMRSAAKAKNRVAVVNADYRFHRCIVDLSGHARLQAAYGLIEAQTRLFLRITSTLDYDLTGILQVHQALMEAILSGDGEGAELLARDHNTPDGARMVEMLKQMEEACS
ncbi:MAG: GntR family transcriptional regulator [Rhodospirillales bacterium]|nr:GntR family transcriptional regulator [Rhodospirillales bacterium]